MTHKVSAPVPKNESDRLAALIRFEVLDTPPEAAFDQLTALALKLFQVPIALISLVDRQRAWFKSCQGLLVREINRTQSFCTHTIMSSRPLVISNTLQDERFNTHPMVVEKPGVRFYAAVPLCTAEGYNIGTFAIMDTRPRQLNLAEKQQLANLAALAMHELETRLTTLNLARAEIILKALARERSQVLNELAQYRNRLKIVEESSNGTAEQTTQNETLNMVAASIAHDFKNILTAIIGNLSLARAYSQPEDPTYPILEEVEQVSLQASELSQKLMDFAKGNKPVKKPARLEQILEDSARFLLRNSGLDYKFNLPPNLWKIEVDRSQFGQVIQNLVVNAIQAMPGGGKLEIGARNMMLTKDNPMALTPGMYVVITVQDSGSGIRPENLAHIFEPYFTTKQQGHGLGLATCHSIMKELGGQIGVTSHPGDGTTFYLYLPVSKEAYPIETIPLSEIPTPEDEVLHRLEEVDYWTTTCN